MDDTLEITVNRRRFDAARGVRPVMTAADIAELIGVPPRNAVVEREIAENAFDPVPADRSIPIARGMHFLVTRHFVMGG